MGASTTTRPSLTQPAVVGGLVSGVLSALPIISTGNLCCCLWVVGGGAVAAYLLQQNSADPIDPAGGALVGLYAGFIGALVYIVIAVPVMILMGPFERQMMARILERLGNVPPELRDYAPGAFGRGLFVFLDFVLHLVIGAIFSTLGGLGGGILFRRKPASAPPVAPPPV